jgi:uncharacterized membrane protein YuzA (DUF378 family)
MIKIFDLIATILVIIGGLNWGLVGLFNFNLVDFLFGKMPMIERLIYIIVGLAAIYMIIALKRWFSKKPA